VLAFSPILSPALSATEGNENQKQNPKPRTREAGIVRLAPTKNSCAQRTQNRFTAFELPSPVRRRVAQAGQEISARTV